MAKKILSLLYKLDTQSQPSNILLDPYTFVKFHRFHFEELTGKRLFHIFNQMSTNVQLTMVGVKDNVSTLTEVSDVFVLRVQNSLVMD